MENKGGVVMKKIILLLAVILIAAIAYSVFMPKTVAFEKDILSDVNFSKVKVSHVLTDDDKINTVSTKQSDTILTLLKMVEAKKVLRNPDVTSGTSFKLGGSGGSELVTVYKEGYLSIGSDPDTYYEIDQTTCEALITALKP